MNSWIWIDRYTMIYHDSWIWRFPKISKIGVHCPQSSRIFHCKPSMWRYPHLWKLPYKYISTYINICMYIACVYMNIYIYAHTHIYIYVCVCELKIVTSFEFDVHSHWLSTREAIDSPGGRRSFATCNSVDSFWGAKKKHHLAILLVFAEMLSGCLSKIVVLS
jgi:hypothetical protein